MRSSRCHAATSKAFTALCDEHGQPWTAIGAVNASSGTLEIRDQFTVPLDDLRAAHTGTLQRHFAATAHADDVATSRRRRRRPDAGE